MELQWPLMIFTLFICLGAGTFGVQGLLCALGKGKELQFPGLIVSFASIVIGGLGSFFHLQHWERIFNGFGHLTSGITQELIAIVFFCIMLAVYFFMMRKSGDKTAPQWCGIAALVMSVVLVVVMAHSYGMPARPAWNTPVMWFYYLSNAAFFGAMACMCIAGIKNAPEPLITKAALVGGAAQAVMTAVYVVYLTLSASAFTSVGYYFDPTHPTKAMADPAAAFSGVLAGSEAALFWAGVVVVGLIVPLVAVVLCRKKDPKQVALIAGGSLICALVGGMCFRVILYVLGFSVFVFY